MLNTVRSVRGSALLLAGLTLTVPGVAATSGQNGVHDPSRIVESNGKFFVYSTGGGSIVSSDGLVWSGGPRIFPNGNPSWVATAVPNDQGLWAPDAISYNGQYYLFYSFANKAAAIGVLTSPTLDTTSPSFKWTDHGMVVSNPTTSTYGSIDPAPVVDADNNLWLTWGSGYIHAETDDTIYITRLDNNTGLASTTDTTKPGYPLVKGHVEGSYMYLHNGYYYLWWNSGGCCSGASSTYTIHVARSQKITGPFTDARIFYASTGSVHGPGHLGIYSACGVERMTYHYYPDSGGSVLGENELTWGADGWPVVGAVSTTPLKPCGMTGTGGVPSTSAGGMGVGGAMNAGTSGSDAAGVAGNSTSLGGSAGNDSMLPNSGGASSGGVAAGVGGSIATGGVLGVGGTTASFGGALGTSGGDHTSTSGESSGCSCSLPSRSKRHGLEGLLIAIVGILRAGARLRRRSSRATGGRS